MPFLIRPTLGLTLLDRIRLNPKLPAYSFRAPEDYKDMTWREHSERVRTVAEGLHSLGVKADTRIAIASSTRYEWALADHAILAARAVSIPIYPNLNVREIRTLLEHSEAEMIFVEDAVALEKIQAIRSGGGAPKIHTLIVMEEGALRFAAGSKDVYSIQSIEELGSQALSKDDSLRFEENLRSIRPGDLYTIVYTSGTTGSPKGVRITHSSLMSALQGSLYALGSAIRSERECSLAFLPFSHIFGRIELAAGVAFGIRLAFSRGGEHLLGDLRDASPTLLYAVPSVFEKAVGRVRSEIDKLPPSKKAIAEKLLEATYSSREKPLSIFSRVVKRALLETSRRTLLKHLRDSFGGELKLAISGGAPLPREIGEFFYALGFPILEGYGLTETCAPITLNPPKQPHFGTVGKPLPHTKLKIAPDGEILVQSPNLFDGYEKDPHATSSAFQGEWFLTGDMGHLGADGYLSITGRKKDLILLSSGEVISPQKIENLAKGDPRIRECVVFGDGKPYLTALLTLQAEEAIGYANSQNIFFSDFQELMKNPRILAWAKERIDAWNEELAPYERIEGFFIHPQDLSVESGEMTPSLKVRRRKLQEKFRNEIESLYLKPAHVKNPGKEI